MDRYKLNEKKGFETPPKLPKKSITKGKFPQLIQHSGDKMKIDREWMQKANPKFQELMEAREKLQNLLIETKRKRGHKNDSLM